jgi:hypothetical protein
VRSEIVVAGSCPRALTAFVDAADLRAWWGVDRALVEPQEDGVYALAWAARGEAFSYVATGVVGAYEPGRSLYLHHYTYLSPSRAVLGPMRLNVGVQPEAPGSSRVTVIQDGYRDGPDWDWYYDAVRGAWPVALAALRDHLARVAL